MYFRNAFHINHPLTDWCHRNCSCILSPVISSLSEKRFPSVTLRSTVSPPKMCAQTAWFMQAVYPLISNINLPINFEAKTDWTFSCGIFYASLVIASPAYVSPLYTASSKLFPCN